MQGAFVSILIITCLKSCIHQNEEKHLKQTNLNCTHDIPSWVFHKSIKFISPVAVV